MSADAEHTHDIVSAREEMVSIPTYPVGEPDPNPLFYYGRHYQGARGRMYPYPLLDRLSDNAVPKDYRAIIMENSHIELTILPEIGGRLFSAMDKSNGYHFLYRQHVIKPVLIGMVGAWISGGAEWNIPHHHRVSVFMPIDHRLDDNEDGSKTLWITEIEQRHHMKWTLGITLYPGRSYFEVKVKIFNRTPLSQSFLYFTNAAVHANDNYQVIFPPHTQWGTQHAKCEFISWPIGQGKYAGLDYNGVDVSWWKNHPNPVSIFAWNDRDSFFGGYDHGKQAGVIRVADSHVTSGMKFFEFGNGNIGRMWDSILTDGDGPYVELMSGSYSDNQPDYSWIEPYETREATEYWYPIRDICGFQNANKDAALFLQANDGEASFGIYSTHAMDNATVKLTGGDTTLYENIIAIGPDTPFRDTTAYSGAMEHLYLTLIDNDGNLVIDYRPAALPISEMPEPVVSPPSPKDIPSIEELYLTGLRLELFHNPALNAEDYYTEALSRDPEDIRTNTRMGILLLKHGEYDMAREALMKAVSRLSNNYTRPQNGEPLFYLGLTFRLLSNIEDAKKILHRAALCQAWRAAAYFVLAEIAMTEGNYHEANDLIDKSLMMNGYNTEAHCLQSAVMRKLGYLREALVATERALELNPVDYRALNDKLLINRGLSGDEMTLQRELSNLMSDNPNTYLDLALDYGNCGQWRDAMDILVRLAENTKDATSPLVWYAIGYCQEKISGCKTKLTARYYALGAKASSHLCFPTHMLLISVLEAAREANPNDARAPYYLGCLLYDHQPSRAIELWEHAMMLDENHPQTLRCLAEGYAKLKNDTTRADSLLRKAMISDPNDLRFPLEFDIVHESAGVPSGERLKTLEEHKDVVLIRDDVTARMISLYLLDGKYDDALKILHNRRFHVWEGNEGFVHSLYTDAHLLKGRTYLRSGDSKNALEQFHLASLYPQNLEMGEPLDGGRIAEISHWMGRAYKLMHDEDNALKAYRKSVTHERKESALAYFQGLSWRELGEENKASEILSELVSYAQNGMKGEEQDTFFDKFGQKESDSKRRSHLHYLCALGFLGLGEHDDARKELQAAININPNHLMAKVELQDLR